MNWGYITAHLIFSLTSRLRLTINFLKIKYLLLTGQLMKKQIQPLFLRVSGPICILFMAKCHRGIQNSVLAKFIAQKKRTLQFQTNPSLSYSQWQKQKQKNNSNRALYLNTHTSTESENRKDPRLPGPTVTAHTPTPSQRDPDCSIEKTSLPLSDNEHGNVLHKDK